MGNCNFPPYPHLTWESAYKYLEQSYKDTEHNRKVAEARRGEQLFREFGILYKPLTDRYEKVKEVSNE